MAEKLIKIDELREVMFNVTSMNITYGKACEQISKICRDRALIIDGVGNSKRDETLELLEEILNKANEADKEVENGI